MFFSSKIIESYGIESAPNAIGHVIVIDVLRAFTTSAYAFQQGATRVILVSSPQEAFQLKKKYKDILLIGENGGKIIPGFDYGNSPEQISKINLVGKTIVLRSSSGTQGVINARQAEKIFLGSLVVASATVNFLKSIHAPQITILAMGSPEGPDKEEDLACQEYMRCLFSGATVDKDAIANKVINSTSGQMALDPSIDWKSPGDLACAVAIDKFAFLMPVQKEDGLLTAYAQQFDP